MRTPVSLIVTLTTVVALLPPARGAEPKPSADEAKAFVAKVNQELRRLWVRQATADWIKATYITDDTQRNAAWVTEEIMAYLNKVTKESLRFAGVPVDADTGRMLYLLRSATVLPAPGEAAKRAELAAITAKLEGMYGKGKWCGKDGKGKCQDLGQLEDVLKTSRNDDALREAWAGWHTISVPMKPLYERLVELGDEGAREIGFGDLGEQWRSGYDMPPAEFAALTERLWQQVRPLYDALHCYVRAQLAKTYGKDKVPREGPIPAHLLGNMWAQEWQNIYPLVEPYKGKPSASVDAALKAKKYDAIKLVRLGEAFFTSLGLDPLPKTFWERSQFTKPRDREVVCHASAWDVAFDNDLRIKMCIKVNEDDLLTIHHELGHDYYYHAYYRLPVLFQQGTEERFHEAIGDTLTLSVTPQYLKQIGLLSSVSKDEQGLINSQMKEALERVAFLPFARLVDEWRWKVFSGEVKPAEYNKAWWDLKLKYQGVSPPLARSETDFDPGAKYHVAANVPYMRYFLARILQFQFHRALCRVAGHQGPLYECSIYGNKDAGKALQEMLALGASKPWPEALKTLTGQSEIDPTALLDFFAPLQAWLKEQNKGRQCGW